MHYFKYATKDATIYSGSKAYGSTTVDFKNTGLDEILELEKVTTPDYLNNSKSRILLHFDLTGDTLLTNSKKYYLVLNETESTELPLSDTIYAYPLTADWDMGIGKKFNEPYSTDGATWLHPSVSGSNWGTPGGVFKEDKESSYSFEYETEDVRMDVTTIVTDWLNSSYTNYGFLVKRSDVIESGSTNYGCLKFFSRDTNTIYPPKLEVCWDDSTWDVGSSTMGTISDSSNFKIYMKNIKPEYKEDAVVRFRLNCRDKYQKPTAQVGTTSLFTNYYLPSGSCYYSIKDANTEETIIKFDEYSKISADSDSNYFDLHMNGLQPERYYRILFKTEFTGSGAVDFSDEHHVFKVVR